MFIAYNENNKTLFASISGSAEDAAEKLGISDYIIVDELPDHDIETLSIVDGTIVVDPEKVAEKANLHKDFYHKKRVEDGITINGVSIKANDKTERRLHAARTKALEDNSRVFEWEAENGFATLSAAQLIVIADAFFDHIDICFKAKKAIINTSYQTKEDVEAAFDAAYDSFME